MTNSFRLLCFAGILLAACSDSATDADTAASDTDTDTDAAVTSDSGADAGGNGSDVVLDSPTPPDVTYSEHVAPLIADNCGACHIAGGSGPFVLDDYDSLTTLARSALAAMESGTMPPWMPSNDCTPIEHARAMDPDEVSLFADWIDAGMPLGPELPSPAPPTIEFEPTHSLGLPEPYTPSIDGADDYRCFILNHEFPEPLYLTANTVHPGNGLVHHVIVYGLIREQAEVALAKAEAEDGPGYTCFGGPVPFAGGGGGDLESIAERLAGTDFPAQLGAWVPGQMPNYFDGDTAMRIEAGTVLVMQVHYSALAGAAEADAGTEFQAILTPVEPERLATTAPVFVRPLNIPAGEPEVIQSDTLPYFNDQPLRVAGMTPHMHLLGTQIRTDILRGETGAEECGLHIPDWDFDWQESYSFERDSEILLNSGDSVRVTCTFDNSAANQPVVNGEQIEPRDVAWGEETLDEMCLTYLSTTRPFTPPLDPSMPACSPACAAECGGDLACVATSCGNADMRCFGCALAESISCGSNACLAQLAAAQPCLGPCVTSTIILGSNFGTCMEQTCGERFVEATECVTQYLSADDCAEARATCGL